MSAAAWFGLAVLSGFVTLYIWSVTAAGWVATIEQHNAEGDGVE